MPGYPGSTPFDRHVPNKPGRSRRYEKQDRIIDVWWWSDPSVDKDIVQVLKSLGAPFPISSTSPLRKGMRLHTRRTVLTVMNQLRRRTKGASNALDISVKEVDTPPKTSEYI